MAKVDKKYQDRLEDIKKNIKESYDYFKPNYDRYWEFKNFVFRTALTDNMRALLKALGKPDLEFNITEAKLSRLRGEFAKQEPSIEVSAQDDMPETPQLVQQIQVVQGYVKHVLYDSNKLGCEYDVYTDQLGGGFSVLKVTTDYVHSRSFNQDIKVMKVFDPTLCGFDKKAQLSHKGDGDFCFEYFPKTKEAFKKERPDVDINNVSFARKAGEFSWSYRTDKNDILLECYYYEKRKDKVEIVELADGQVMTKKEYKQEVQSKQSMLFEQIPDIIDSRMSDMTTICRYHLIEDQVIGYIETDFKYLPLVFVDGNSVLLRDGTDGPVQQMTRPYIYQAKGAQMLTNFAGQSLASELEDSIQSKWIFPEGGLPTQPEYLAAIKNNQLPSVVIYKDKDVNGNPVNPPAPVVRAPIPPEIPNTFMAGEQKVETILGNFDQALGGNNKDLSGKAIIESITLSNSAAMPYIVRFLQSWDWCAQIIVDLIPKYLVKKRSIPTLNKDGKRESTPINMPNGVSMQYAENSFRVKVEPGVNFAIQKSRSLAEIIDLAHSMPVLGEFFSTDGLPILLQNVECAGADEMRMMAKQFQQKKQQQMAQQQAMAMQQMQNNPQVQRNQIEAKKVEHQIQQDTVKNQLDAGQQSIDEIKAENDRLKLLLEAQESQREAVVRLEQQQTEKMAKNVDMAIAVVHEASRHHGEMRKHDREDVRLHHDIIQANKPKPKEENNVRN